MTLQLTPERRAALSRNSRILVAMGEAEDRGDMNEYRRLFSELDILADALLALKSIGRTDLIQALKLRTHRVEEMYGPNWLDLTEEEERALERTAG